MFKLPKDISKLSADELGKLLASAVDERDALLAISDEDITDEQIAELETVVGDIATINEASTAIETAATARAEKLAALRATAEADDATGDEGEEGDEGDEPEEEEEEEVDVPDDASALEPEPVAASAARKSPIAKASRRAPKPKADPVVEPKAAITAAANVPQFTQGQALPDMRAVAEAFAQRGKGWARSVSRSEHEGGQQIVTELSDKHTRAGVARVAKPANEFSVMGQLSTQEQMDVIMAAANEKRLPKGGLIAAGGWCAPSETLYGNFLTLETVSGLLSIAEVQANRGGINFTKGPDYATIAASWGFLQTEAQAIAGNVKTCYDVTCPPFTEVRLDAIGFCVKAGVLTEAAYPELIDRVLQIGAVAHAHKVNASVIGRISTYIGAAIDHAEIGATTSDVLDAVALQALRLRYTYSMDPNATIEAVFPLWAKEIFRSDLSRRTGVDMLAVTDAQIQSFLGVRGIAAQWVYDYQNITSTSTATWTSFPDVLEVMMYPAGSYVKLTTDVIDLDTIYDSVGLSTNTFTAAFFEEGIAVANTGASGVKVSINVSLLKGQTGAANVGTAIP